MLGLILYALYRGYIPIVNVSGTNSGNIWESFFLQPFGNVDLCNISYTICERDYAEFRPKVTLGFHTNKKEFEFWSFFIKKVVILNDTTKDYIQNELNIVELSRNSLGVLIRGTDYTSTKPSGHPVQPTVKELIERIKLYYLKYQYDTIYVATEEQRLFKAIQNQFGDKIVKENKRQYYDEIYYKQDCFGISDVHFDREHDDYYKGLEYLSSLVIMSKCQDIIAGNCGGTVFALLYSDGYRNEVIFNKGVY